MIASSALAPDAAMVLGIAATAMPFARTPQDEAERWLRLLRLHGEVGVALQALGVGEQSSRGSGEQPLQPSAGQPKQPPQKRDPVALVGEHAARLAARRELAGVTTTEVLRAVMHVYGEDFELVLRAHGTDGKEVLARLGESAPPAS